MSESSRAGAPPMMKIPHKISFYPKKLLQYEGYGYVNHSRVARWTLATCIATVFITWASNVANRRVGGPPPKTLTEEWKKAEEQKRIDENADPISNHKVGRSL
eukprot:TRINITY_DN6311_c0_g1_i1.p2 TRINITY_DN6311_c0_g1~~TRINITY_DN6311_c0_g1_i1.p2  ORF type:complete len:103 (-),score=29.62 TRINITY_DN6311_c0_g1_i1:104-412(-)